MTTFSTYFSLTLLVTLFSFLHTKCQRTHCIFNHYVHFWSYNRDKTYSFECVCSHFNIIVTLKLYHRLQQHATVKSYWTSNILGWSTCSLIGYVFNSIPQGLNLSPSIFQTALVDILEDMLYKSVTVYLDDICVFGETLQFFGKI